MTQPTGDTQQTPDQDAVELSQDQGTEVAVPTTSPDVVITDDPGPAPDPNVEQSDDGETDNQPDDPDSTDESVLSE